MIRITEAARRLRYGAVNDFARSSTDRDVEWKDGNFIIIWLVTDGDINMQRLWYLCVAGLWRVLAKVSTLRGQHEEMEGLCPAWLSQGTDS